MSFENQNSSIVPSSVTDKFNWGAFLLTWIWGLGNKTYITLIALALWILNFVPYCRCIVGIVSLGVAIWFGIKGNEWAWRNNQYDSIEEFHNIQKKWAVAGLIVQAIFFVLIFSFAGVIVAAAFKGMGN